MFQHTDRIAVAFSGGKDSTVLLSFLVEIQKQFPESEIIAITLDEGIAAANNRNLSVSVITQLLGVEHIVSSYQELYSVSMDEVAERAEAIGSPHSPCAYCGIMRRQGLNILARRIQADKLALGHNLDDEVQSMVMNLIRGDLTRLARFTPVQQGIQDKLIPRIKPLHQIPENEVALYAQYIGLPHYQCPCIYGKHSMRTEIRKWLNALEERHPGTKYSLASSITKIIGAFQGKEQEAFRECQVCKEPTSRKICTICEHLSRLGLAQSF